jgi:hypothetical protein
MILAIDPGLTTGYATRDGDDFHSGQRKFIEFLDWAYEQLVEHGTIDEVACESFIITQATAKKSQAPWSLESIGAIRFFCHHKGIPFQLQQPSSVKKFATDARIQKMGWYRRGKGHANDAARHLFFYECKKGRIPTDVLL